MVKITSKSQLKSKKFNLNNFKPFCFNERKKKHKRFEYPKFKNKLFWKSNKIQRNNPNLLIVSGPSRSGNHLLLSLLDNHPQLTNHPGEEDTLRFYLAMVQNNEKEAIRKLKSGKLDFYLNLSGQMNSFKKGFDKWKEQHNIIIGKRQYPKIWSGSQPEFEGHILDYEGIVPNIDYPSFKNYIVENLDYFKNIENFFEFFFIYLNALRLLVKEKKNLIQKKYPYRWFGSGLRREMFYILKNLNNVKCLCPIRDFGSYYFSFTKARFGHEEIKQKPLNEFWEHWRHKVIDLLLLQKKYPKKVHLLSFEGLIKNQEFTMKKISKHLNIRYHRSLNTPSILGKKVKGNSSFKKTDQHIGKIYDSTKKSEKFPYEVLPKEYFEIRKILNKKFIND